MIKSDEVIDDDLYITVGAFVLDGTVNGDLIVVGRTLTIERAKDDFIKLDLEEQIKKYVAESQPGMIELIHANPQTPEGRDQVFMLKKRIVDTVLEEERFDEKHEIHVRLRTNFLVGAG